jgi:uncharacterized membrane protein YccC
VAPLLIGALAWGVLIGLLEWWRRALGRAAVALVVLFALRVGGGIERDFVLAAATIIQITIALLVVLAALPLSRTRGEAAASHEARRLRAQRLEPGG